MILNFLTSRTWQTVQTQNRLLLVWSGSTIFAIPSALFGHFFSMERPLCLNFAVITANILGVLKFRTFTVYQLL